LGEIFKGGGDAGDIGRNFPYKCRDLLAGYKSVRIAIMIWDTLVNTQTHTDVFRTVLYWAEKQTCHPCP